MAAFQTEIARRTELAAAFANEAAFRRWYDGALPRVFGYLLGHTAGDRDLAEEIVQEAFIDAVAQAHRFDGRSDPVTWVCAIARHKLMDHFRRMEREERRRMHLAVREIRADREALPWREAETRQSVVDAMRALPVMQRAALTLLHIDGLSIREISRELGKSESAIESLLARARENFRRAYGEVDR